MTGHIFYQPQQATEVVVSMRRVRQLVPGCQFAGYRSRITYTDLGELLQALAGKLRSAAMHPGEYAVSPRLLPPEWSCFRMAVRKLR